MRELAVESCIGVGGTVAQLQLLVGELRLDPKLNPDRAPVIVTGALIVRQVLRRYGLDRLTFSERDLLDGVALTAWPASATSRRCP